MKIESIFQLGLTFFGLTQSNISETRLAIFSQIHQIVFHGKGGYDWNTVYNMPIWLRRFTFNELIKFYEEEKKVHENVGKKGQKTVVSPNGTVNKNNIPKHFSSPKPPVTYK